MTTAIAPRRPQDAARFMAAAVRLGRRHLGLTRPNPSVGALVVRDDGVGPVVVGRGVTGIGGRPHAERLALAAAGPAARGATLYVSLEPCSHHGVTPPCVEAILDAGIVRVVIALEDPDPRVSGSGAAFLRSRGIEVVVGLGAAEAERGLRGHLSLKRRQRPYVTLKLAVSADETIGRRGEGQVAITSEAARARAHMMRAESDAVVVGVGTALADDPLLTVRLPGLAHRTPVRAVLDSAGRLPRESRLVATAGEGPVWIVGGAESAPDRLAALAARGVDVLAVATTESVVDPAAALSAFAARGIGTVLLEGGAKVAGAFLRRGLVDEIAIFQSPIVVGTGGIAAPPEALATLRGEAPDWTPVSVAQLGPDRLVIAQRTTGS